MSGFIVARRLGLAAVCGSVATVGLCYPDRHQTVSGDPHRTLERFLDPPWHLRLGVVLAVGVVDVVLKLFLLAPGRSVTVTTHAGDGNVRAALDAARLLGANSLAARQSADSGTHSSAASSQGSTSDNAASSSSRDTLRAPLLVVLNHNTLLDAPLIAPILGRAATSPEASPWMLPWTTDAQAWPFCIGSATLLFNHPLTATLVSLICGMPIQPKWVSCQLCNDRALNQRLFCLTLSLEPLPNVIRVTLSHQCAASEEVFDLNRTQYIPAMLECLRRGRTLVLCPEVIPACWCTRFGLFFLLLAAAG
jgi:hypothetical protein